MNWRVLCLPRGEGGCWRVNPWAKTHTLSFLAEFIYWAYIKGSTLKTPGALCKEKMRVLHQSGEERRDSATRPSPSASMATDSRCGRPRAHQRAAGAEEQLPLPCARAHTHPRPAAPPGNRPPVPSLFPIPSPTLDHPWPLRLRKMRRTSVQPGIVSSRAS